MENVLLIEREVGTRLQISLEITDASCGESSLY